MSNELSYFDLNGTRAEVCDEKARANNATLEARIGGAELDISRLNDTTRDLGGRIDKAERDIVQLNSDLDNSVVPVDIAVAFGSSAFTNKITFCKKIGRMIFYNIRFTTGSATYPTTVAFAILNYPSSELPTDQSQTSMIQKGSMWRGASTVSTNIRQITDDNRIGIFSDSTLQANETVYAFGFIMLK